MLTQVNIKTDINNNESLASRKVFMSRYLILIALNELLLNWSENGAEWANCGHF